ncbi:MAG: helix-turn-helix transcriptional regulator, partial [Pseudonocardia sp.]|nr:helix-turn-helix transcriptional regulator [Pseudonocardia sp.]
RAAHSLHAFARLLSPATTPATEPATDHPATDHPATDHLAPAGSEGPGPAAAAPGPDSPLTGREQEIGRLILAGLTYKQIGQRLYISAKTVEHYVARMRQRLGVATRGEMFALLQATLGDGT